MKQKTITLTISKYDQPRWDTHGQVSPIFKGEFVTSEAPAVYIGNVIAFIHAATGWTCDNDDHLHLETLWRHGAAEFKFGPDWEYFLEASVMVQE